MSKPSIPKGTRDFLPDQTVRRRYIFDVIRKIYERYGYLPIETPAMETLATLTGKYGEEGDRLIFKILNSGDYLAKADQALLDEKQSGKLTGQISEKALRYDLTVPFARFVVQHQNDLSFPFKRYQIQPVWRADRPQKGRYREFYQCDADVVGSASLWNEVELVGIIRDVFGDLGLPEVEIRLNNRKILAGLAEALEVGDKLTDMTVAIDKLDKIGAEGVLKELEQREISAKAIEFFSKNLSQEKGLSPEELKALFEAEGTASEIGLKGLEELAFVMEKFPATESGNGEVVFDFTLARGLDYYTGAIIEVGHPDFKGSVCGGGRYDDLTGIFGLPNLSGVGISFGADRIYDLMLDKGLFPDSLAATTKVMFVNFGEAEAAWCMKALRKIRSSAGINAELYPDKAKMKKQMKYADDKQIPFVVLVGDREIESGLLAVKEMASGNQENITLEQLIEKLA